MSEPDLIVRLLAAPVDVLLNPRDLAFLEAYIATHPRPRMPRNTVSFREMQLRQQMRLERGEYGHIPSQSLRPNIPEYVAWQDACAKWDHLNLILEFNGKLQALPLPGREVPDDLVPISEAWEMSKRRGLDIPANTFYRRLTDLAKGGIPAYPGEGKVKKQVSKAQVVAWIESEHRRHEEGA